MIIGNCQVGESRPNIVGLKDAPSTICWGRIGLEALNLTIPFGLLEWGAVRANEPGPPDDDSSRNERTERATTIVELAKSIQGVE